MRRLRIDDLPKDVALSPDEMKQLRGGAVDCFLKIEGVPGESGEDRLTENVSLNTRAIIDVPH